MTGLAPQAESSSQSRKPRASKPKVKTGCITCKARRVKCDETKPDCLRCSNFGRKCAGYPSPEDTSPPKKEASLPVPTRRLLSKAVQVAPSPSPSPSPSPGPVSANVPIVPVFHPPLPAGIDDREIKYLNHFRDETAMELSSGFEPTLWNVLVLQACDNSSIRKLCSATAALSLALRAPHINSWDNERDSHREYALQKYGEAVKEIRVMVAMEQDSIRVALISALLIFCFESLHGELGSAIVHVQSALEMIVKHILNSPRSFYFSRVNFSGRHGKSAIEEDLLTAFMRLDRPSLTLLNTRKETSPLPSNRIFTLLFSDERLKMPREFASTTEARVYLEDIKWRISGTAQPSDSITLFWQKSREIFCPGFESIPIQFEQWPGASTALNSSSNLSLELAHWHDSFSPLLNYSMTPAGDALFLGAVTLHIQALAADLLVSGVFSSPQSSATAASSPHTRFPTVHAILLLSRRLIAHCAFLKGFVFDIGIIPSLVNVMILCPERDLKLEAIQVLKSMVPRREGVWDSKAVSDAGDRFMDRQAGMEMIDPNLL